LIVSQKTNCVVVVVAVVVVDDDVVVVGSIETSNV
jgi:hypothetical protein